MIVLAFQLYVQLNNVHDQHVWAATVAELNEAVSAGLPEVIRSSNCPLLLDCLVDCFAKEDSEPPPGLVGYVASLQNSTAFLYG
jgi:hypothetical protein